jgi:hypothetical protein
MSSEEELGQPEADTWQQPTNLLCPDVEQWNGNEVNNHRKWDVSASQIAFSFTNGRFARHEFTSQHQSQVRSENLHILIRNKEYSIKENRETVTKSWGNEINVGEDGSIDRTAHILEVQKLHN